MISTLASTMLLVGFAAVPSAAEAGPNAVPGRLSLGDLGLPKLDRTAGQLKAAATASAPATAWTPDGTELDVFQVFQNTVGVKSWTADTGWEGWFNAGAPAAGVELAPSVVWALDQSRVDIFVTGLDNHPYQRTFTSAGGSEWTDLVGEFIDAPSASATARGRIDVFGIGRDFRLYQKTWLGSSWTEWVVFAAPAAGLDTRVSATWTPNGSRLDIFATGAADGHLYQKSWLAQAGWLDWVDLGGVLTSAPAAVWANNGGRVDVFGIGTDGRMYQKTWLFPSGWTGWVGFNPPAAGASQGAAASWTGNGSRIDVMVSGDADEHVYQLSWLASTGWIGWVDLDAQ